MTARVDGGTLRWSGWDALRRGEGREVLEQVVLPAFLSRQRWFGGKARQLAGATLVDLAVIDADATALTLIDVGYADGGRETYVLPLAVAVGPDAERTRREAESAVLAPLWSADGDGVLYDAVYHHGFRRALLDLVWRGQTLAAATGHLTAHAGARLRELAGPEGSALEGRLTGAEQSNTSIRYGDRLMLKLFRRPSEGPNPEREVTEFLTDRAAFPFIARFGGSLEYRRHGRDDVTVAVLQAYVPNVGDAWTWTLAGLDDYFQRCAPGMPRVPTGPAVAAWLSGNVPDAARAAVGAYLESAALLGRRTAELHVALGSAAGEAAFAPEVILPGDVSRLVDDLAASAQLARGTLEQNLPRVPADRLDLAHRVLAGWGRAAPVFEALRGVEAPLLRTRIHGDYHLGQVLRTMDDFVIVDFEGEPARSLAERRARHSPVKDVAGMLRSFCYAAEWGRRAFAARQPGPADGLDAWAGQWQAAAGAAFLRAYRQTVRPAALVPADDAAFGTVLGAYLLDKALYELRYELDNRPSWVGIPLEGVWSLLSP